jgi:hypothetical protein
MADIEQNIDRYFSEHLGKLEAAPPESNWENIAGKLNQNRRKKALLLFFRIAAGMTILISTGIGVLMTMKTSDVKKTAEVSVQPMMKSHTTGSGNLHKTIEATPGVPHKKNQAAQPPATNNSTGMSRKASFTPNESPDTNKHNAAGSSQQGLPELAFNRIAATIPSNVPGDLEWKAAVNEIKPESMADLTPDQARSLLLAEYQQDEEVIETKTSRWTLGGEVAPQYSYRTISSEKASAKALNNLNESESGLLAYSGGIRVAFATGKRLSLQSGLYYSRYGEQNDEIYSSGYFRLDSKSNLVAAEDISHVAFRNSTGSITGKNPDKTGYALAANNNVNDGDVLGPSQNENEYTNTTSTDATIIQCFDFIELPVTVQYKIIDRKIDFSLKGGVVTNFLFGNSVKLVEDGDKTNVGKTRDVSQVNYMGSISLGVEYPVAKEIAVTLEPRFRYCINSFNESSMVDVHPYSFGIFAGINYYF